MNRLFFVIVTSALALSACGAAAKLGLPTSTPSTPTVSSVTDPQSPLSSGSDNDWKKNMITKEQQAALIGMTPDQATKRLKELGHTGDIQVVHENHYVAKCGVNKICSLEPGSDMPKNNFIVFTINPEVTIAAPPADD